MNTHEERKRGIEALRPSIFRLIAANLRIGESPLLETVLREALEGARVLRGLSRMSSKWDQRHLDRTRHVLRA